MKPVERDRLQASLRRRLLTLAHSEGADFQTVLTRYGLERFLYRLGHSRHRGAFLVKGAFLYHAWLEDVARPTRDLDLLGYGSPDISRIESAIAEIAGIVFMDDGLDFPVATIRGEAIREASLYDGIRIRLVAQLGRTRIPLQLDVGFGDAAGSDATDLDYPTLLDHEPPHVRAYRPQYVVAEKLEAMVALGFVNSRLKDYYDLWRILTNMEISDQDLLIAIQATFAGRRTGIPRKVPDALTAAFAHDAQKIIQWEAFLGRSGLDIAGATLDSVVRELRNRLVPLLSLAGTDTSVQLPPAET